MLSNDEAVRAEKAAPRAPAHVWILEVSQGDHTLECLRRLEVQA